MLSTNVPYDGVPDVDDVRSNTLSCGEFITEPGSLVGLHSNNKMHSFIELGSHAGLLIRYTTLK